MSKVKKMIVSKINKLQPKKATEKRSKSLRSMEVALFCQKMNKFSDTVQRQAYEETRLMFSNS